ncbi:DNA repair protein RadA, partial [Campylobacter sp.]
MAKTKAVFECESCGYQCGKWLGKCPNCGAFESIVELSAAQIKSLEEIAKFSKSASSKATPITEVEITELARTSTGDSELDLVLGGGLVEGSLVLIGGSPGIGKSTLLLKVASNLAKNAPTLYVSGEESASQIKLRADRLGANERELFLLTEINLGSILASLAEREYKFLVIDSIQTLYSDKITAAPGSISQVREITFELMRLAKEKNISIFIIGHITKEGSIAGPRILEHMVDVVLYFEGDSSKQL